ncbi:formate hydrogenase [Arthrobacter livingstonensis]|uniref:Formate hydrogenase n=1 Tax=Arthrobacter livingstonensis TaxID=670078 RepID=A0A2V5L0L0_9MICC|nr:NADH-quinone oxidoreductase subunit C [Arthrobacter livingstonensis]PYI64615.1 formate hydrogenase [Arthrobacter livingstonensis]
MTNGSFTPRNHPEVRALDRSRLRDEAAVLLGEGYRLALVACHEDKDQLRIVYAFTAGNARRPVELVVPVPRGDSWVPSVAALSYPAGNFEREMRDLYGVRPDGHPQPFRLVRHGHWPRGWYPMLHSAEPRPALNPDIESFPFVEVEGPGVYEIAVGPIHAGIIEPGHFRFSVVGETILRMEARQWYMHRGVEKLFQGRRAQEGIELAEQISGDTAVGHTLAFLMAVESAAGIEVSAPDRLLRAMLLEMERMYNHVTDLGSLANDTGLSIIDAHAQRLRERLLRINKTVTGHRFLRGALTVGGTRIQGLPDPAELHGIARDVAELVTLTLGHSIVRDRFTGTATLPTPQARAIGALGYVARASGMACDARQDHPFADLGKAFRVVTETSGDVLGRYRVRAQEYAVSTAVVGELIGRLGRHRGNGVHTDPTGPGDGMALIEGWRGSITHRVELGPGGVLTRVKIVDPSFFNWPALPLALAETIVPDFPLANKSFNQSYAGNDL